MKFSSTSLYYWEADVKPSELKQTWHVSFAFCLWSAQSLTQSHACFYLLKEAKGSECGHLRLAGFAFGILCQIFKMYIYGENIGFIMSESRLSWFFLAVCSYFTAQKYLDPVFHVNRLIFFGLGFGAFCSLLPIYLGYILRAAICKEIEYFQVILSSGYIVAVFLLAGVIRMFLSSTTHGHLYKPKEPSSYECFYLGLIVVYSSFLYFTNEVTVCIPTVMFKKIGDIAVFLQCVIIIWFSVIMLCIIWEIKADKYFCSVFNATFYKFFIQTNFISKVNFALNHNLGAYNVSDVDKFVLSCRSVGALVVKQINGEVIVKGTCFRVGPNYVISNLHVYNNIINAHQFTEGIYVDFDYTIKNGISPSCCTILKIIIGSEDLDYIIFEIGKSDDVELPKSVTSIFKIPSSVERANEGVFHFCGYPDRADQKKVNLFCPVRNPEECLVMCLKNAEQQLLQDPRRQCYDVSTFFHGSSGSPGVLLEYGALMVLHCRGFFLSDSNGSIIEQGVLMSAIVADVTNELGYDRALELFDLDEKMELD